MGADLASTASFVPARTSRRRQVSRLHRSRLLAGAVTVADEVGYAQTTVSRIAQRAGVSRGTFYALFADRDDCLAAVYADLVEAVAEELSRLQLEDLPWRERVRCALITILGLLDSEPALARVCVVECARGGPKLTAARERAVASLAGALDAGRDDPDCLLAPSTATAEILVHAVFGIAHSRLAAGGEPLSELFGELMGLVVLPYLGPEAAQRESNRPPPDLEGPPGRVRRDGREALPGAGLSAPKIRLTYRTTRVLECIAESPGATNIAIARAAGISDQGQISKLLARLEQHGLLLNSGDLERKWAVNTWSLTQHGEALIQGVRRRPLPSRAGG